MVLDHVLSLKVDGLPDVDVVNLGLGRDDSRRRRRYDAMLKAFYNNIFVVSSARTKGHFQ
jgi:hypothetical protein